MTVQNHRFRVVPIKRNDLKGTGFRILGTITIRRLRDTRFRGPRTAHRGSRTAARAPGIDLEIAIKVGGDRLDLPDAVERYVPDRLRHHGFELMPIPFDRLLVAQAQIEGLTILTADPAISRYDVEPIS